MTEFPWPKGTLVLCKHRDNGLPLKSSCAEHIWRLETDPKPVDYGCGFIQAAQCLICGGGRTAFLDADFFYVKVDPYTIEGQMTFAGAIGEVQATIQWYQEVLERLGRLFLGEEVDVPRAKGEPEAAPVLMDFG